MGAADLGDVADTVNKQRFAEVLEGRQAGSIRRLDALPDGFGYPVKF